MSFCFRQELTARLCVEINQSAVTGDSYRSQGLKVLTPLLLPLTACWEA